MLALLQALEHPVLASGISEFATAFGDVAFAHGQLTRPVHTSCLDPFDERLARAKLLGAEDGAPARSQALLGAGILEMDIDRL